jgi:sugar phosphate isomerase/epimerase
MKFPTCYASCSIGMGSPVSLTDKIRAIAAAGFDSIELAFPDLHSFAQEYFSDNDGRKLAEDDYDTLCVAAKAIRAICASHKMKVLVLQPFPRVEGWPKDSPERKQVFEKAAGWIRIMEAVGTDMLQV